MKCVIGNGHSILVWKDTWLPEGSLRDHGGVWYMHLNNSFQFFWKYVWVKKYVKIHVMLFKNWKLLFENVYWLCQDRQSRWSSSRSADQDHPKALQVQMKRVNSGVVPAIEPLMIKSDNWERKKSFDTKISKFL